MGSLIAARLARSGAADVTIAGSWPEALDLIPRRGITVEDDTGRWSAPVAAARLSDVGQADFVLVLVKSTATADVAAAAARALAPGGLVVTLQNGLGNREALERAAGAGRVAVGVATLGATLLGPGHVRGFPGEIVIGASANPSVLKLIDAFRAAGIDAGEAMDLDRLVWRKLAVSCAVNPVTALLGAANGALLASAESRDRAAAAAREVGAVAAAKGIDVGADPADLALAVAERTAGNRSSMLQDLDRGARTEVDALCGAVVAEGRRLGVPTPVNEALWREVRAREGRPVAKAAAASVA
jgi:2-dehydropantoate 2-reductase